MTRRRGELPDFHPAVRHYLEDANYQMVSKPHVPRAARILQAMLDEIEARGIAVAVGEHRRPLPHQPQILGHAWLTAPLGVYLVRIEEVPKAGAPARNYAVDARLPRWQQFRSREFVSTGILRLVVAGNGGSYEGYRIVESKRTPLEAKVATAVAKLEAWESETLERKREWRRLDEERERRRQQALEDARRPYVVLKRWEHFLSIERDAADASRRRAFLAKALDAARQLPDEARASVEEFIADIRRRVDASDPLCDPTLLMPTIPEPTEAELKQFMPDP